MNSKKVNQFNMVAVVQNGRLQYEALLFMASLHASNPQRNFRIFLAEPEFTENWPEDPRLHSEEIRFALEGLGAEFITFKNDDFGAKYPNSNKFYALKALPAKEPFVFFDTDTVFTGSLNEVPFNFKKPMGSMRREGTWPEKTLYGPGYTEIWKSLYDKFKLDFETSLDLTQPEEYWQRYLYFNAGFFFGADPHKFANIAIEYMTQIYNDPPEALAAQNLFPWLDQIVLPLVIHKLGGGRHTLPEGLIDGSVSFHYRKLPLLYALGNERAIELTETLFQPNKVKKLIKPWEPFKKLVFQQKGKKIQKLFANFPKDAPEIKVRKRLRNHKLWLVE